MKKLLIATAAIFTALPAYAQNTTTSIGAGFNFGHVNTGTNAASVGSAAAGSLAAGNNTSIGAGIATVTPAGSLSAGLGASSGQSSALSGAASIGNGAAATSGVSNNVGVGVGIGYTNRH